MTVRRILAAVDASEPARRAAERAVGLAKRWQTPVTLLHVYETVPAEAESLLTAQNFDERSRQEAEAMMAGLLADLGHPEAEVVIRAGRDVPGTICELAESRGADLVVVGTLGRTGVSRFFLGSVAEQVTRHAPCPVWVERARGSRREVKRMIACTDLSAMSEAGLGLAATLVEELDVVAEIVCALEPRYRQLSLDTHRQTVAALKERLADLAVKHFGEPPPRTTITEGSNVVDAITAHAIRTSADLVVLATHGRTGLSRAIMGSVAERVTRFAPCSVLVARSSPAP